MQTVKTISEWMLPCLILIFLLGAFCKKTDAYQAFLDGAKESMTTIVNILPPVVGLMIAIAMLRGSGLLDFLCGLLSPATAFLGIPTEVMPLALLRPISGSGGIAPACHAWPPPMSSMTAPSKENDRHSSPQT